MLDAHTLDLDRTMASKDTVFYEQLGQRIAEFRKTAGMTQTDLAEQLGIAQQTMAHYEGGKSESRSRCCRPWRVRSASRSKR